MAAPALEKTWQKAYVQAVSGEGPTQQTGASDRDNMIRLLVYGLVDSLRSFASGAWTVVSSCGYDSGSWTYGVGDNWNSAEDVRYKEQTGGQFSWVVLQQNGIKTGFQVLIALENDYNDTYLKQVFYVSHSGSFTGGTETTRPTASDEMTFETYSSWFYSGVDAKSFTILVSTDGECTRIINTDQSAIRVVIGFDKLKNMPAASVFDGQSISGVFRDTAQTDIFRREIGDTKVLSALAQKCRWLGIQPKWSGILSLESTLKGPDANGEYPAAPVPIWSEKPLRFMAGQMFDCYAVSDGLTDGDGFPADDSNDFIVVGHFIIGNDGTELVIPT